MVALNLETAIEPRLDTDRRRRRRVGPASGSIRVVLRLALLLVLAFKPGSLRTVAADSTSFSRDILPILSDNCFACHGPDEKARKAGLRLDTREGALGKGKSGELAIVPKDSGRSEIIRRLVARDPDDVMPPPKSNRKLSAEQVEVMRRWIDQGAVWGRHWAFESPLRPPVPVISNFKFPIRNPIDAFVQARLAKERLIASPEAPRATLIRRVTLDLTGLPPTSAEVAPFVNDPAPDAYEDLVDRLLASPRFGERMAWEWLEAARYADSNGYQGDSERTMWPWRDWVVDAFNRNLPFDQFSIWQLAGDRLPEATFEQRLATGFLRNHMINGEGGRIPEENRIEYLFDQTETVATVWLGATFNCTRCHDHKFDPFTQRDYYGLMAFFNQTLVDGSGGNPQSPPNLAVLTPKQTERLDQAETQLGIAVRATEDFEAAKFVRDSGQSIEVSAAVKELPKEIIEQLKVAPKDRDGGRLEKLAAHWKDTDPDYVKLLEEQRRWRNEREAAARDIPRVMVMEDLAKPRTTFVLNRGNYLKPGAEVTMAVPASLKSEGAMTFSDRLDLARWLMAPENPLTARVTVNRFWQAFFGVGLVKTAEDFGVQGQKPANAELLDWLATEFVESGWDVKHLVRLMATSATYRQSSQVTPDLFERDPENRLLARGPRYRLPSWMIRDAALATAGLLTEQMGGRPVKPYQPAGVWEEATFGNKRYEQDHGASLYRRSLYVFWRRIVGPTMFFDVASRQTCTVKTPRTNVPLHALLTLNDPAYVEAARELAQQALLADTKTDAARIALVYQRVLGRKPTAEELRILTKGLGRHRRTFAADREAGEKLLATGEVSRDTRVDTAEHAAWTVLCSTILNLDETLTKE